MTHMKTLPAADNSAVKALRGIGDEWIAKTCVLFPEQASRWGFKKFEPLLGENTPDVHRENEALLEATLRKVEGLPEGAFSGDGWLDRRGFLSLLRTDILFSRDLQRWRTNPRQHVNAAADVIFDLAVGRERFEFLIRERLGLNLSLREAKAAGERLVVRQDFLLQRAAAKIGRRPAHEVIEEAASKWTPPGSLLEHYQRTTREIKRRLADANLVSLPKGESLKVLPVPPFLRHQFPTVGYNPPQPFARSQTGMFWVNDLSLEQPDPEKKLAEIRQHFGLELTSVHEAYPGHHLQFVVQFQHPSRIRRLFEHSIYYEGWTMWCEQMAVDHGLVDFPHAKLVQLHDALWRAHRIVIDCGLQEGTLTPAAAARRLEKGVGFTSARATGDVNWYTSSPAVPMSYLLGRLEVEKLHRRLVGREGWTLMQFNDWMLSHGSLPWSWIRQASL